MSSAETLPRLTLFQIEEQLLQLMEARDDAEHEGDAEAAAVIDGELRKYVEAEVKKADGIAAYIREGNYRADLLMAEAGRIELRAKAWQKKADRLREITLNVMREMDMKRIEGRHSTIRRIGNGGVTPLVITQPDLLTDETKFVEVMLTLDQWGAILDQVSALRVSPPQPFDREIRRRLANGEGVPGCRLGERGEHLEID